MKKMILLLLLTLPTTVFALPTAKYTLKVIDEGGEPIEGIQASISFMEPKSEGWGGDTYLVQGETDSGGIFTGSGETQAYAVYGASGEGYYPTGLKYQGFNGTSGIVGFRRWEPWNPTLDVVLKPIKNPIPMYARKTDWIEIPKVGEFIGYDLKRADWVVPYGSGLTADFLFKLEHDIRSRSDYDAKLTLRFSNEGDGIQSVLVGEDEGSMFKLNYEGPERGYKKELVTELWGRPNKPLPIVFSDNQNYYFRVRSELDSEGNVEEGLYGKIHGNIEFERLVKDGGSIRFTYYLNPTSNDRNIEFNPKKNLFKRLEDNHKVVLP